MFGLLKNRTYPIGVDMGDDALKLVQLEDNGRGISLVAVGSEDRPADVKAGSGNWQKWAIEAICQLTANGRFQGRDVIAAIPASEIFIDHIKMPKAKDGTTKAKKSIWRTRDNLEDVIFSKIKQKLPFGADEAMIKYIPTEDENALVMATERRKIDRYLAIYEKANLQIKSIGIWPAAMVNSYAMLFGRRKADIETVVMLLDVRENCTSVVICRHKNLLFAHSVPIGAEHFIDGEKIVARLVLELTACIRHFCSMHRRTQIERLIFLSGRAVDRDICTTIARQLEMPAQMGDCLAAVEIADAARLGIDRRQCQFNWATAFGLSLSQESDKRG